MPQHLDSSLFKTVMSSSTDDHKYTFIRPLQSPIILFSEVDGSALASIHLKCTSGGAETAKTLFTRRPFKSAFQCDFQGMISKDDQEFQLVITNLSKTGNIQFNIWKQVGKTHPGAINEYSELQPLESYTVQSDWTNQNKVLILNSIKKKDELTGKEEKLKVEEAESKDVSPSGTYYLLTVLPQKGRPELVNKFKKTVWNCADIFYTKDPIDKPQYHPHPHNSVIGLDGLRYASSLSYESENAMSFSVMPRGGRASGARGGAPGGWRDSSFESAGSRMGRGGAGGRAKGVARSVKSAALFDLAARADSAPISQSAEESAEVANLYDNAEPKFGQLLDPRMGVVDNGDPMGSLGIAAVAMSAPSSSLSMEESDEEQATDMMLQSLDVENHPAVVAAAAPSSAPVAQSIIKDSYAASVSGGRQVVVNAHDSQTEYDIETPSVPCVVGLSISDKLEFTNEADEKYLMELAKSLLDDLLKNQGKELLAKLTKIFEEANCTICMDGKEDQRPVDSVFYQCGHQCCHYECAKKLDSLKCPICRNHIAAMIKV